MKRRIPLLVVVALALVAYGVYRVRQAGKPFEWSGTVESRTIEVGSRVGGRVSDVLTREGHRVDAGQVLLVFEPGDLEGQRMQARGTLEQAQAQLERLVSAGTSTVRQQQIAAARAQVKVRESVRAKAGIDLHWEIKRIGKP